jgi:ketosteroid isomerase-like protein
MSSETRDVILRYYSSVGDLNSAPEQLELLLSPDIRVVEHPNAISPHGSVRGRDELLAARRSGRALLSAQSFTVHEILDVADRAAVRATWTGTVGMSGGSLATGAELRAEIASFITVHDGRIVLHETFDCYPPLPRPA